jgi:hypothetical protein
MGLVTTDLCKELLSLCANCIMAPQNRNVGEDNLRPYCSECSLKWEAAAMIKQLRSELAAFQQPTTTAAAGSSHEAGPCWCGYRPKTNDQLVLEES